jgi:hypothetical protein
MKNLFVFYTENPANDNEFVINMDKNTGWIWIGAGKTYPIFKDPIENKNFIKPKYEREIQFSGELKNIEEARNCLNLQMENLEKENIISCFVITEKYLHQTESDSNTNKFLNFLKF